MSFAETTPQVRNKTKTITRRLGWLTLKAGDMIQPCLKCMGLKKGEKIQKVGKPVKILRVTRSRLDTITKSDVVKEGFPDWTKQQFITFFCKLNKCQPSTVVTRIRFKYTEDTQDE